MSLRVHCETHLRQLVKGYERAGREVREKRVYATTERRMIHVRLSREIIPVKGCQGFDAGRHGGVRTECPAPQLQE